MRLQKLFQKINKRSATVARWYEWKHQNLHPRLNTPFAFCNLTAMKLLETIFYVVEVLWKKYLNETKLSGSAFAVKIIFHHQIGSKKNSSVCVVIMDAAKQLKGPTYVVTMDILETKVSTNAFVIETKTIEESPK